MAKRHWIAALLVVSLGLNLLGAGALLARLTMSSPPGPMAWAMGDLDPSTRERVGQALRGRMQQVAPVRREFKRSQAEIKRVVSSDPLDEAALTQALVNLRDISQRYQLQLHNIALDVLPQLSTEQRRRATHRLLRAGTDQCDRPDRNPQRHDGRNPPPPKAPEQTGR